MSYKLYYFDSKGYAEPIRMILTYGGVQFEDLRQPIVDHPPKGVQPDFKKKCRWGQMPVVEFPDGRILAQSLAITRYFAKKFDLCGKNDFEAALCDEYVDTIREFITCFFPTMKITSEEEKKRVKDEVKKSVTAKYLNTFHTILEANGGKFLVGDKLSWADIYLAHTFNRIYVTGGINFLDNPIFQKHSEMVLNTPGIKKWMDNRPQTKY